MEIRKPEADDILPTRRLTRKWRTMIPVLTFHVINLPPVSILKEHRSSSAFDNSEVIENKENIIKTLGDYKISIKQISATVGPTVTLYEIIRKGVSSWHASNPSKMILPLTFPQWASGSLPPFREGVQWV